MRYFNPKIKRKKIKKAEPIEKSLINDINDITLDEKIDVDGGCIFKDACRRGKKQPGIKSNNIKFLIV